MMTTMSPESALEAAIERAGSQSELARMIRVSTTSVWKMVNQAKRASVDYVLAIEAATGVSRYDLRPDIYPREDSPAPPSAVPPCAADGSPNSNATGAA